MQLVTGAVPSGDDFYEGRKKYVALLKEKIEKQEVALIGPRRTGKTSIIKALFEQLDEEQQRIPIYINLESCSTPYDIITEIAKKLLEQRSGWGAVFANVTEKANEWAGKFKENFGTVAVEAGGVALKVNLKKVEPSKLEKLGNDLKELCGSTEVPVVIALDELPEAIWKYVNEGANQDRAERVSHIGILLSFFRDIRQTNKSSNKLRVIYSGSINFIMTLKKLGFSEDHNDLCAFNIPFLKPEETYDIANQLVSGEKILLENPDELKKVMDQYFGFTTPYYVQLYVEQLKNRFISKSSGMKINNADLVTAYQNILSAEFGPEYFFRRIETYHKPQQPIILRILKAISASQESTNTPCSANTIDTKGLSITTIEVEELMRTLYIEDFFQQHEEENFEAVFQEDCKYYFKSNIIKNYWNRKLRNL